ncbi:sigma factor-like helix-turn-helix DNA-binding protein [Mycoplasma crocodyli]|uniref:Sigma-70 factor-like HTH protein n=1 Tax=Mycoplasma crocodyli (strain ATCC 51981 / MP145) TaxID=512564 RepID=D5E670_MYCCM|nr:sigma factor-like helix-turn-helix DNA-binding protein [Mycoplasma crocodyli]ADE19600.1 sigma-70 factor-like HTH protein [Mycoplasma crocodyli MP145]
MENRKSIESIEKYTKLYEKYSSFLTQSQSQVFQLFYFEDLSYGEIAQILATSRTNAYDTLAKTIKKLEKIDEKMNVE